MTTKTALAKARAMAVQARQMIAGTSKKPQVWSPHKPTPKQTFLLDVDAREAFYGGAAGGGKLLRLDEPIPTPDGWTLNGELQVGDEIFDERGVVTRVTHVFAVETPDRAYRLTFDDGSTIEAGAEHRWVTFTANELASLTRRDPEWRAQRRARRPSRATGIKSALFTATITARNHAKPPASAPAPEGAVRTTEEIYKTLRTASGRTNHAITVAAALDLPPCPLPLDPYCLGAWLGDGTALSGGFTGIDPQIWEQFEVAGFTVTHGPSISKAHHVLGMIGALRQLGVCGNKHIPSIYLRASRQQRLDLLCGLMDTDGTVCDQGAVEFTNTNKAIIDSVYELIVSLGWKAHAREGRAMLYGKDCGPVWDIKWTPSEYVFRLDRKRDKQRLASRRTTRFRYVVNCEPCQPTPMRCISVDSPSRLYLAGRQMIPTHNSDLLLMAALKYVDNPNYAALILRRTMPNLEQADCLIPRSHDWLQGKGCKWNERKKEWTFPSGARLKFASVENEKDKHNFQSSAYQFIGFDELTEFDESVYTYLFSRCRRNEGSTIPLRVYSAANPGGYGGEWVYKRFVKDALPDEDRFIKEVWEHDELQQRFFVPAKLRDNPFIDAKEYISNLRKLDPVTMAQLLNGDWLIRNRGDILDTWDERFHVITWSEFARIYGKRHIPVHWMLARGMDVGASEEHPHCLVWIATAAKNSPFPGTQFVYRSRLWGANVTIHDIAQDIKKAEKAHSENERMRIKVMSHERTHEQLMFNQQYGLQFNKWKPGRTHGISQFRDHLQLRDTDRPNPFRIYRAANGTEIVADSLSDQELLFGRPMQIIIVEDGQGELIRNNHSTEENDRWIVMPGLDEGGQQRVRAEAPAYKWATTLGGQALASPVPHAFFNDMMDCLRGIYSYLPALADASEYEKQQAKLPAVYRDVEMAAAIEQAPTMTAYELQMLTQRMISREYAVGALNKSDKRPAKPSFLRPMRMR